MYSSPVKTTMTSETASLNSSSTRSTITSLKSLLRKSENTPKHSKPVVTVDEMTAQKLTIAEARATYFMIR